MEDQNIDQAPNKPEDELIVCPDQASIYNRQGEKFEELMNSPLVYIMLRVNSEIRFHSKQ